LQEVESVDFNDKANDHLDLMDALLDLGQDIEGSSDRHFPQGHDALCFDPITFKELEKLDEWLNQMDIEKDGAMIGLVRRLMRAAWWLDKMRVAFGGDLKRLRKKWAILGKYMNDQARGEVLKNSGLAGPSPKTDLEHWRITRAAHRHWLKGVKMSRAYAIAMEELGHTEPWPGFKPGEAAIDKAQARIKRATSRSKALIRIWNRKKRDEISKKRPI
jgi:hypothetical protein